MSLLSPVNNLFTHIPGLGDFPPVLLKIRSEIDDHYLRYWSNPCDVSGLGFDPGSRLDAAIEGDAANLG
jgi:hypothetical protein